MENEKKRKLAAAATATCVLLLFILILALIFQWVAMARSRSQINALKKEITELEQQKQEYEDEINKWLSDWKIQERARELGWLYPGDK